MMTGEAVDGSSVNSAEDSEQAVTFTLTHLGNDVVRVEAAKIVPRGDMDAPSVERLSYPLSCAQQDVMREALRLVGMGEALSSVSIFDGYVRAVAPGVVAYTVWLTG